MRIGRSKGAWREVASDLRLINCLTINRPSKYWMLGKSLLMTISMSKCDKGGGVSSMGSSRGKKGVNDRD